ncbi:MAG: hypothetical protein JWO71_711 [Candidatus Acidoferrum typicum]|nr:hypothetical protein [Candidatus Acidoferrum typicum]
MDFPQSQEPAVDIFEYAQRGAEVPHAHRYHVRIDGEKFEIDTPRPTGEFLLGKVGKRPCAFELIEEFTHCENDVVEPKEEVDLRKKGLKGFITAHKDVVEIFIDGLAYRIERGDRTVAEILGKVNKTPEGYVLLEEKEGPPMPVPPDRPVKIKGCEIFFTQVQSGASS